LSVTERLAATPQADTRPTRHESFLAFDRLRYLKWTVVLVALSVLMYQVFT
jgi:hypothetical protein